MSRAENLIKWYAVNPIGLKEDVIVAIRVSMVKYNKRSVVEPVPWKQGETNTAGDLMRSAYMRPLYCGQSLYGCVSGKDSESHRLFQI